MTAFTTADLYDNHETNPQLRVVLPGLRHFGGKHNFSGQIVTVKVLEDNSLVRSELQKNGQGKVLVVDGGGSLNCALLGDLLAKAAVDQGWEGIIVNSCIRDSSIIASLNIGVMAIATNPRKSVKRGIGEINLPVIFLGVQFSPGEYLYADLDGIIVAANSLI